MAEYYSFISSKNIVWNLFGEVQNSVCNFIGKNSKYDVAEPTIKSGGKLLIKYNNDKTKLILRLKKNLNN